MRFAPSRRNDLPYVNGRQFGKVELETKKPLALWESQGLFVDT